MDSFRRVLQLIDGSLSSAAEPASVSFYCSKFVGFGKKLHFFIFQFSKNSI
jgi:hypothetical protein